MILPWVVKVAFHVVTAFKLPLRLKGVGFSLRGCIVSLECFSDNPTCKYQPELYRRECECCLQTTNFPAIKEVGSSVAWLTFSYSYVKSYISEGPVRHVGL